MIKIWDLETGANFRILTGHGDMINSSKFTPDNKFIISSSWDFKIKIWDVETGLCVKEIYN